MSLTPSHKIKSFVFNHSGLYKAEDFISSEFIFNNDIVGTGVWCFGLSPESNRDIIELTGDKGFIRFSTFSFEPIVLSNNTGIQEFVNEHPQHVQYNLIEKVVQSLNGAGIAPSTGESGARTSWVMDEVVREYYKR